MTLRFAQIVRGPLLVPRENGTVDFFRDGALAADESGTLTFVGDFAAIAKHVDPSRVRASDGVMLPPFVDIHTHIPQHPIRGRFEEGVPLDAPGGVLLASLQKNVFPAEAKCHDGAVAQQVVEAFARDTLSHGVVGGCAYMTVSATATDIALAHLPSTWSVGMVLMNRNCPDYLRTDEPNVERDLRALAAKYGKRHIVTDRFAVAVDSPLRRKASNLAGELGQRTQTHLNEQVAEKAFVEGSLHPDRASYTDVYLKDGLLDHACILAHCIQMTDDEWSIARDTNSVIAHCPTSNLKLSSGVMPLDEVIARGIPYAIATDVGASPTQSMLAEMGRFLSVHNGRSTRATPSEALYRATRAPARILGIDDHVGSLEVGRPMTFIEVRGTGRDFENADDVIRSLIPEDLDHPKQAVSRMTVNGSQVEFSR